MVSRALLPSMATNRHAKSTPLASSISIPPRSAQRGGKLYLFVCIDRTSKLVFTELRPAMDKVSAAHFRRLLLEAVPYKIHTILTGNGLQFADGPRGRSLGGHIFGTVCREHGIEHRLTKPYHPWTNGQVDRMNRTLKEATVRRCHCEFIMKCWASRPQLFKVEPSHHAVGPYS